MNQLLTMPLNYEYVTIAQVAETFGCAESTLEELHRTNVLVGVRLGNGGLRYPRDKLADQVRALMGPEYRGPERRNVPQAPTALQMVVDNTGRQPPRLPDVDHSVGGPR